MNAVSNGASVDSPAVSENLLDKAAALHLISDPEILTEYALDTLLAMVHANSGSFFLWDEFKKELALKSLRGQQRDRLNQVQIKLREGILGWVGDRGNSILVKDIHQDERFQSLKRNGHYRSNSFISIPLITHHKLIGVINITERENLISFTEEDLEQVHSFAKHIAVAYDNLKSLQHLKRDHDDAQQKLTLLKHHHKAEESLITVGKLATHLAHELNNPLDAIRRYVNLALDQSLEDSMTREYLLKAKKGIRRAIHVIRGLLQLSRESYHDAPRSVDVHELIDQSLHTITEDLSFQKIAVEKKYTSTPSFIRDRGLPLVLRNLFQNAQHAMSGEGTISVSTERVNGTIVISVEDTGSGVAEHIRPRLFEPFFSTKNRDEGTGIGLAICKEIVERCGGNITCENGATGARFVISIPCVKEGNLPALL